MSSFDDSYKKALRAVKGGKSTHHNFLPGEDVRYRGRAAHILRIGGHDAVRPGVCLIKFDDGTGETANVMPKDLKPAPSRAINRPAKAVLSATVPTKVGKYKISVVRAEPARLGFETRWKGPDGQEAYNTKRHDVAKEALDYGVKRVHAEAEEILGKRAQARHDKSLPKGITPAFEKAIAFFKENAGGQVGHAAEGALKLARAEKYAEDHGWTVEWEEEPNPDMSGMEDAKEVLSACLKDQSGKVLECLGGIGDPSRSYRRVVEAELALEAMPGK
jgi:hypothetical protein